MARSQKRIAIRDPRTMNTNVPSKTKLHAAVRRARSVERTFGKPHYVVVAFDGTVTVTNCMPMFGEWYTSDGIQHGGRIR